MKRWIDFAAEQREMAEAGQSADGLTGGPTARERDGDID